MNNLIQIDMLRVEKNRPRKCVCKVRKFTLDTKNREVTCGCGIVHDPFEAMLYLASHYHMLNEQAVKVREQIDWLKQEYETLKRQKPSEAIFKELEEKYNLGRMLPMCPCCGELFHFKDIKRWSSSIFYKAPKHRRSAGKNQ